jgi:hypothetical protein
MDSRLRLRRPLTFLVLFAAALAAAPAPAAENAPAPALSSEARLRRDITFLASDRCEGRGPMTPGLDLAADYIAAELKKAGLKPAGADGTWFQPFTLPAAVLERPATLALHGPLGQDVELRQGSQFHPMGVGRAGKASGAPLVFAGYGITSTGKTKYNDYDGLDVEGKVVVLLRGAPLGANNQVAPELWQFAPFVRKLENAAKHKAAAALIVNDADTARDGDHLIDFNYTALDGTPGKLPAFHLKRAVLEAMLPGGADGLRDLERRIDRDLKPHSFALTGWSAGLEVQMRRDVVTLKNVVGTLEGAGPLAKETVVVGAHYDHLGYGGAGGSRSRARKMEIHHGADDNGSGTTALMELARRFAALKGRQGRRLVFVAFSGEELGLFGSKHYCKEPPFPLADTAAMFNLDMVGRLRADDKSGKDKLLVEGNATSKTFDALVDDLNRKHDFTLQKSAALAPNSDHFSFYQKKVPVLFFWTGYHPDYHMPSDTADKINVPGMRRVVDLSQDVIAELATVAKRPEYVAVKIAGSGSPTSGPRLGVMPGYAAGGEGMLIEEVVDGGPAVRAGLKAGDRIVGVGEKPVTNVQTYMQAMSAQKKGTTIDVHVLRDGKRQTIKVKLD